MAFLRGLLSLPVLLLGLPACGPEASDTDPASTSDASSSTGVPTTGSTGSSTGVASTTGGESTAVSSESGEVETTGGLVCSLEAYATDAAQALGAYEDCGVVDPWDDLAPAWQAARDCALKAASEQRAFKLITWLQGFDSQVGQAYVGLTAESYAITMFHFDSDPCGGGGCGPVLSQSSCDALAEIPNCVVEPGGPCLGCLGQSAPVQVCGPR